MKKRDSDFNKIISDIKSIKIQGATPIAKAGIRAYLKCPTKSCLNKIISARPTEPMLKNYLKILSKNDDPVKIGNMLLKDIDLSQKKIFHNGVKLIKDGMNIFTHCHSSSVIGILKEAKKHGKNFHVYTIEVEPLLQGRMTAEDLAKAKIKTTIGPDLAAEQLLQNCDLFLFGADAYTKTSAYNKIGTATLCKLAKARGIPRYSCGTSMKYAKKVKIENRKGSEVWVDNLSYVNVVYPAFDKTSFKIISGIISELGVLRPKEFIKRSKTRFKN